VEEIAKNASPPIAIESLCDELNHHRSIRGITFFGWTGAQLEKITSNYPGMQWWISEKGLNIAILPAENAQLSAFDQLAGRLTVEHWKEGKLSKDALHLIAKALDEVPFTLKAELQRAQWLPIAKYNRENSKKPIKTFLQAAHNPRFVRGVRRRLYLARDRFKAGR